MPTLTGNDIEFLIFFTEEFEDTVRILNSPTKNMANFRNLATKARQLIHTKESTLERTYNLLQLPLTIKPIQESFLLTEQSENSPAVYRVEFCSSLSDEIVQSFSNRQTRTDTFSVGMPIDMHVPTNKLPRFREPLDLETYRNQPILHIDGVTIDRFQLVSYLSNKKGVAHYSEIRDKKWQKSLDLFWHFQISDKEKSENLKAPYNLLSIILLELTNAQDIQKIITFGHQLKSI